MKKVTKQVLKDAEFLASNFGYWSDEVCDFISKFQNYEQRQKLHIHLEKFR